MSTRYIMGIDPIDKNGKPSVHSIDGKIIIAKEPTPNYPEAMKRMLEFYKDVPLVKGKYPPRMLMFMAGNYHTRWGFWKRRKLIDQG